MEPTQTPPKAKSRAKKTTDHGVVVAVRAFYLEEQSNPQTRKYVFAYRVTIENTGKKPVQLMRRRWRIIDAQGRQENVDGEGVIGEQPVIIPGKHFEYMSGTPLATPSGFMVGTYQMRDVASGALFEVPIPVFSLDSPHADMRIH